MLDMLDDVGRQMTAEERGHIGDGASGRALALLALDLLDGVGVWELRGEDHGESLVDAELTQALAQGTCQRTVVALIQVGLVDLRRVALGACPMELMIGRPRSMDLAMSAPSGSASRWRR